MDNKDVAQGFVMAVVFATAVVAVLLMVYALWMFAGLAAPERPERTLVTCGLAIMAVLVMFK